MYISDATKVAVIHISWFIIILASHSFPGYVNGCEDYYKKYYCYHFCGYDFRFNDDILWDTTQYSTHLYADRVKQIVETHVIETPEKVPLESHWSYPVLNFFCAAFNLLIAMLLHSLCSSIFPCKLYMNLCKFQSNMKCHIAISKTQTGAHMLVRYAEVLSVMPSNLSCPQLCTLLFLYNPNVSIIGAAAHSLKKCHCQRRDQVFCYKILVCLELKVAYLLVISVSKEQILNQVNVVVPGIV